MALNVDTSRAFRTLSELSELVEKVVDAPAGTDETNWIEFKSDLDLNAPHGKFTVAKAILAFSNRALTVAAHHCDGVAYVIIGAEPQKVVGIKRIDHADLSQKLATYIDDGPRWTPYYVTCQSKDVLVIVVEPPRQGDRIHVLKKTLDNAYEGTVYVRGTAQSEPAKYQTMQMLQERLLVQQGEPEFDLALLMSAKPVDRIDFTEAGVIDWLAQREAYIRSTSERPPERPAPPDLGAHPSSKAYGLSSAMADMFASRLFANPKDAEVFEERVKTHIKQCKKRLPRNVLSALVRSERNKINFRVTNTESRSVVGVQLVVSIQRGLGVSFRSGVPTTKRMPDLPKWPDDLRERMYEPRSLAHLDIPGDLFDPRSGQVTHHKDVIEIIYDVGDLTPGESRETPPVTAVVAADAPEHLPVFLTGRAMTRSGNKRVEKILTVTEHVWRLDDFVPVVPH